MASKLLSVPVLCGSLLSIWLAIQISVREQKNGSSPRGLERIISNMMLKCERLGRRRWVDDSPRKPPIDHLDLARVFNAPLLIIVCLAWVWPSIDSPQRLMGAAMLTLLAYLLVSGLGSLIAFFVMLGAGWARAGEEGGGGEKVSLYHPDGPSGGQGLKLPEIWVSDSKQRLER